MARGTRRSERKTRPKGKEQAAEPDPVPAVFRELLEEDKRANEIGDNQVSKKRRRVGEGNDAALETQRKLPKVEATQDVLELQTMTLSSESEEEWEDVDIGQDEEQMEEVVDSRPLEIVLNGQEPKVQHRRRARRPATLVERRSRLETHKLHLLCQLYHGFLRNHWCNDVLLQKMLRDTRIVPSKAILKLHPEPTAIQIQRSRVFKEGLAAILEAWRLNFRISGHGIQRPLWPCSAEESQHIFETARDSEAFADLADFRKHALDFEGSIDYSAQLFCALLRGLEVDARLIFSLQPLGFDARGAGKLPDEEYGTQKIHFDEPQNADIPEAVGSDHITPQRISRLGRSNGSVKTPQTTPRRRRVAIPRHPIFWVEVFDKAYQKWISIDPAVTGTIGKVSIFEPALNDPENVMTYVMAYEDSGVVKDVTRQYAKAYIAKTRKFRVESTENGDRWFKRAMRPFRRQMPLDRDIIEENMLLQREISEGMPKNVEDFKGHPIYVLERHLRRDEVIHPKRKVGQIAQRASSALELVYRREDVHLVRSADKWFRMGRQIKMGETPLKRVVRKRRNVGRDDLDELQEEDMESVALYASFQTELYIPEPVVDGQVPRNGFRNLDVYVPSMIPPGGVHIKSRHAKAAARLIGVDAVDAVTGFEFRGRHGTAKIDGVVVASEFRDAVSAVAQGLAQEEKQAKEQLRRKEERRKKKRLLTEKRIRARIRRKYGSEDDESFDDEDSEFDEEDYEEEEIEISMLEDEDEKVIVIESTAKVHKPSTEKSAVQTLTEDDDLELFGETQAKDPGEGHEQGGFMVDDTMVNMGGGFIVEDTATQIVGGFIPEAKAFQPRPAHVQNSGEDDSRKSREPEVMTLDSLNKQLPSNLDQETSHEESKQLESYGDPKSPDSLLSHDPDDDDADPDWLD